jgi:hypothetical protein
MISLFTSYLNYSLRRLHLLRQRQETNSQETAESCQNLSSVRRNTTHTNVPSLSLEKFEFFKFGAPKFDRIFAQRVWFIIIIYSAIVQIRIPFIKIVKFH